MKQLHVKYSAAFDPKNPSTPRHTYTVTKVTNAVFPHIGAYLDSNAIETYCESDEWTVTVT